jgi:hypothetical protein
VNIVTTSAFSGTKRLESWLENWYSENHFGPLISALVYFVAAVVAFCVGVLVIGYVLMYALARGSRNGNDSVLLFGVGVAVVFVLAGTVYQMFVHNRHKIRLEFQNRVLFYAGFESVNNNASNLIGNGDSASGPSSIFEFGDSFWVKIATFPGWLFMKSFESLIEFWRMHTARMKDAAVVLAYMVQKDGRCFPPELEEALPQVDVPAALAFLLQISGVSAVDAATPGVIVGSDRLEQWQPLLD